MYIQQYGDQLALVRDDGTILLALPTSTNIWTISEPEPDPEPEPEPEPSNDFKWPFNRAAHTTYPGHSGMDWGGGGKQIKCIGPGTVAARYEYAGNTYGARGGSREPIWRGHCLVVDHGMIGGVRISSLYAHMLQPPANRVGDRVSGGTPLGLTGNTGYSSGSHLHFEVIFNNQRLSQDKGGYERTIGWMDANARGVW